MQIWPNSLSCVHMGTWKKGKVLFLELCAQVLKRFLQVLADRQGMMWEGGEPRAPQHQSCLAELSSCLPGAQGPWELWKFKLYTQSTHTHPLPSTEHPQKWIKIQNTWMSNYLHLYITQVSSRNWTLSSCNSFYHFAGKIPRANPRVRFALPGSSTFKIFHILEHGTPANHKVI